MCALRVFEPCSPPRHRLVSTSKSNFRLPIYVFIFTTSFAHTRARGAHTMRNRFFNALTRVDRLRFEHNLFPFYRSRTFGIIINFQYPYEFHQIVKYVMNRITHRARCHQACGNHLQESRKTFQSLHVSVFSDTNSCESILE